MINSNCSIHVVTGSFPARSQTFVQNHVCGMASRGWYVSTLASNVELGMTSDELDAIDNLGVQRNYWGAWSSNRFKRLIQMVGYMLFTPATIRYWNGQGPWARSEMLEARRMCDYLKSNEVKKIHVHFGHTAAFLAAIGWDKPTVVTWHGYDANMLTTSRGDAIYRELFERDWKHTVGSSFMQRRLIELGARKEQVFKIPMGIDLSCFQFVDRSSRVQNTIKLVSIGRLDEMKGHSYLIDAVCEVKNLGIDLKLKIIGEGPARKELESQIQKKGLEENVAILGSQPPSYVRDELAASDIFALTGVVALSGRVETQGVAFIEAQATGLPVIGSDVGGVSESMLPDTTGILVKPKDVSAIAEAIATYADNRELRLAHGRAGSDFVRDRFNIDTMLESFEKLYQS